MYNVDGTIQAMALRPARQIYSFCYFGTRTGSSWSNDRTYSYDDALKSLSISIGGINSGMTIGETYCAQLIVRLIGPVTVNQSDRIIPRVGFIEVDGTKSGVEGLGWFYVDSIQADENSTIVVAYDKMLRAEKYYKSKLEYPAKATAVLEEICDKMGVDLAADFKADYDPQIEKKPTKGKDADGKTSYYTMREVLGFLGSIFGGNWFFDAGGKLAMTRFEEVGTISAENEIKADFDGVKFEVTGISWDINGQMYSREDVDATGVIAFENPLGVTKEPVLHALEEKLVGVTYYGAELTTQGMGWFEIGDIVSATRVDGATFPIMITGIDYTISEGEFLQKIHSYALTESESNFAADDNQRENGGTARFLKTFDNAATAQTYAQGLVVLNEQGQVLIQLLNGTPGNGGTLQMQQDALNINTNSPYNISVNPNYIQIFSTIGDLLINKNQIRISTNGGLSLEVTSNGLTVNGKEIG